MLSQIKLFIGTVLIWYIICQSETFQQNNSSHLGFWFFVQMDMLVWYIWTIKSTTFKHTFTGGWYIYLIMHMSKRAIKYHRIGQCLNTHIWAIQWVEAKVTTKNHSLWSSEWTIIQIYAFMISLPSTSGFLKLYTPLIKSSQSYRKSWFLWERWKEGGSAYFLPLSGFLHSKIDMNHLKSSGKQVCLVQTDKPIQ